jgi:hypothetical protein
VALAGLVREALSEFPEVSRRAFVPLDRSLVLADPQLLSQIVTNLLQNVARYAPEGEVEVRIESRGETVALSLADDGPGVAGDRREEIFSGGCSDKGLGLGLGISRDLARAMGGDLVIEAESIRAGATFTLTLPLAPPGSEAVVVAEPADAADSEVTVLAPGARLLVDMTEILGDRSLDRLVAGLQKMFSDLLAAQAGLLLVQTRAGKLRRAGSFGSATDRAVAPTPFLDEVMGSRRHVFVPNLAEDEPSWAELLGCRSALFLPVLDDEESMGVMVVGWDTDLRLTRPLVEIATALARLAAFGAQRAALTDEVHYERRLRSSVLETLPIAVSVFAGDPPRLVDWNQAEMRLLGLRADDQRPADLASSQEAFDVRFIDGTPLTVDNAPVVQTIRAGKTTGPFFLRVRRANGTEVVTRTHCAPFFGEQGEVAGAVVTSEEIGLDEVETS